MFFCPLTTSEVTQIREDCRKESYLLGEINQQLNALVSGNAAVATTSVS
jgi:hypothetical protein